MSSLHLLRNQSSSDLNKNSVTINIIYKLKRASVTLPPSGVTESKLFSLLNIPPWVSRNMEIVSLRRLIDEDYVSDTESGSTMSMDSFREPSMALKEQISIALEYVPHTNDQIKALRAVSQLVNGATYQVIINDSSINYVSLLNEDEKNSILQKFRDIDIDGNGNISLDEIHKYYASISNQKKLALREKMDQLAKNKKYSTIEQIYNQAVQNIERMEAFAIRQFLKYDGDGNKEISLEEFLEGEARVIALSKENEENVS